VLEYSRGLRAPSEHAVLLREVAAPLLELSVPLHESSVPFLELSVLLCNHRHHYNRHRGANDRCRYPLRASGAVVSPVLLIPSAQVFDKFDTHHHGYINKEDLAEILGDGAVWAL
jgi:hypothetical protein